MIFLTVPETTARPLYTSASNKHFKDRVIQFRAARSTEIQLEAAAPAPSASVANYDDALQFTLQTKCFIFGAMMPWRASEKSLNIQWFLTSSPGLDLY